MATFFGDVQYSQNGTVANPCLSTSDFSMEHVVLINTNRSSTNKGEDFAKNGFLNHVPMGIHPPWGFNPKLEPSRKGMENRTPADKWMFTVPDSGLLVLTDPHIALYNHIP